MLSKTSCELKELSHQTNDIGVKEMNEEGPICEKWRWGIDWWYIIQNDGNKNETLWFLVWSIQKY